MIPLPEPDHKKAESQSQQSTSTAQTGHDWHLQRHLCVRDHPTVGLTEAFTGPEERDQSGGVDAVQEREAWVGSQHGRQLETNLKLKKK